MSKSSRGRGSTWSWIGILAALAILFGSVAVALLAFGFQEAIRQEMLRLPEALGFLWSVAGVTWIGLAPLGVVASLVTLTAIRKSREAMVCFWALLFLLVVTVLCAALTYAFVVLPSVAQAEGWIPVVGISTLAVFAAVGSFWAFQDIGDEMWLVRRRDRCRQLVLGNFTLNSLAGIAFDGVLGAVLIAPAAIGGLVNLIRFLGWVGGLSVLVGAGALIFLVAWRRTRKVALLFLGILAALIVWAGGSYLISGLIARAAANTALGVLAGSAWLGLPGFVAMVFVVYARTEGGVADDW